MAGACEKTSFIELALFVISLASVLISKYLELDPYLNSFLWGVAIGSYQQLFLSETDLEGKINSHFIKSALILGFIGKDL